MFGSTSNTPFGTGSTFGTGTSLFVAGNTTTSGLFVQQKTFFAQQYTWGLFGAQTSSASATGFGTGVFGHTSSGQTEKSKPERASTATTSLLQKFSPRPAARKKPKPIKNHTMNKSKLFEGLEEDSGLSPDTFVPRKNIKKLVLKGGLGTSAFHTATSQAGGLFGAKPTTFGTGTAFGTNTDMSPMRLSATPAGLQSGERSSDDRVSTSAGVSPMGVWFSLVPDSVGTTFSELRRRDEEGTTDKGHPLRQETTLPDATYRDNVGVVLKRWEYYTVPPVELLNQQMDSNGDILVDDFVVGREGYGKVKFYGRTNVAGLNLDEIVFFRRREIEVYPDTYLNKPPVGEELNKKAEITLENIWPSDKTTREPIKSPERLNLLGWQKRVETATEKLGATYLNFNLHTGDWVFMVDHFTRFRMDDEFFDDEQA